MLNVITLEHSHIQNNSLNKYCLFGFFRTPLSKRAPIRSTCYFPHKDSKINLFALSIVAVSNEAR